MSVYALLGLLAGLVAPVFLGILETARQGFGKLIPFLNQPSTRRRSADSAVARQAKPTK
ncbi:MAG: hypothetical protein FWC58_11680 [Desulfobulbus sp.]|nr:hypothetical protein [Desulfobulbus sp.]